jgi:hypothetical protein
VESFSAKLDWHLILLIGNVAARGFVTQNTGTLRKGNVMCMIAQTEFHPAEDGEI